MSKDKLYVCNACGAEFPTWSGKCGQCGEWNTIKEIVVEKTTISSKRSRPVQVKKLSEIKISDEERKKTGISEFDLVLGGGFVPGSIVLLGGEPGIGKSTLILQVASQLKNVLYISGEESLSQIKSRAIRLKTSGSIVLANEVNLGKIIATAKKIKPSLLIIDSVQVIFDPDISSSAGSIAQVKACGLALQRLAKETGLTVVLIGHVTKQGVVAGPKTLEHLVDTVLYLEGQRYQSFRLLRTTKNRYGNASEAGLFEMKKVGLVEVRKGQRAFVGRDKKKKPGSVISVIMEGSRPFLVEIQALCSRSFYGYPQRRASGFDYNRMQLLVAVLASSTRSKIGEQDIYLNVVGGLKITEPAADLAVALAIMSAFRHRPLPSDLVALGEIGLSGEVFPVTELGRRIKETRHLGFKKIIIPKIANLTIKNRSVKLIEVADLNQAIKRIFV